MTRQRALGLAALLGTAMGLSNGCSFPEHDFIPADEFDRLKNGSGGVGGNGGTPIGGFGGVAPGGSGGAQGGSAGSAGGSAGADSGVGGTGVGGTGVGGSGGSGGAPGSCVGRCGQPGSVPGSSPPCWCDSACSAFKNCCADHDVACAGTGGTGGATGGTGGATGGTGGATGGTGGGGGTCNDVVINEVSSTGLTASDEYVELLNRGSCTVNLSGWSLRYVPSAGGNFSTRWTGAAGDSLPPGGYWILGGSGYAGVKNATLSSGIADQAGVALLDPAAIKLDSVAWGASVAAAHPYIETSAFPSTLTATTTASRLPNGVDTNDNSLDFKLGVRTPGAVNSQ
ncbi:MAG: lamin tail domain-containing protein [Polyangiaceae bacterium]|nr:lamin tail domain-containing protein [Polyangiaceae bacterium]